MKNKKTTADPQKIAGVHPFFYMGSLFGVESDPYFFRAYLASYTLFFYKNIFLFLNAIFTLEILEIFLIFKKISDSRRFF